MKFKINENLKIGHSNVMQLQKGSVSSTSFSYERKPLNRQEDTIYENEAKSNYKPTKFQTPIKSRLTVNPSDDNNSVTLTHTVSFYRRQQNLNSPSVQKVVHSSMPIIEHPTTDDNTDFDDDNLNTNNYKTDKAIDPVQEKINALKSNMLIQSHQIAQASNALNTCASTFEFSGSTESVVAEWKLLVASKCDEIPLFFLFLFFFIIQIFQIFQLI